MELTCPKCHGPMRTYERNGVHVDQCTECRGIFLDRGELDRLIDAENDYHERGNERPRDERSRDEHSSRPAAHDQQHSGSGYAAAGGGAGLGAVVNEVLKQVGGSKSHSSSYGQGGYQKKRKESFLGDLFG